MDFLLQHFRSIDMVILITNHFLLASRTFSFEQFLPTTVQQQPFCCSVVCKISIVWGASCALRSRCMLLEQYLNKDTLCNVRDAMRCACGEVRKPPRWTHFCSNYLFAIIFHCSITNLFWCQTPFAWMNADVVARARKIDNRFSYTHTRIDMQIFAIRIQPNIHQKVNDHVDCRIFMKFIRMEKCLCDDFFFIEW